MLKSNDSWNRRTNKQDRKDKISFKGRAGQKISYADFNICLYTYHTGLSNLVKVFYEPRK